MLLHKLFVLTFWKVKDLIDTAIVFVVASICAFFRVDILAAYTISMLCTHALYVWVFFLLLSRWFV